MQIFSFFWHNLLWVFPYLKATHHWLFFYFAVPLLENLPDHDALVTSAADLLGPAGWTSRCYSSFTLQPLRRHREQMSRWFLHDSDVFCEQMVQIWKRVSLPCCPSSNGHIVSARASVPLLIIFCSFCLLAGFWHHQVTSRWVKAGRCWNCTANRRPSAWTAWWVTP